MSEITAPKSLEERITTRLHESIGDLITDDDLKTIVERGIEEALFEERRMTNPNSYGPQTVSKPALVDELVEKLLGEKMRQAIDRWLRENPEALQAAVDRAIALGVGQALLNTLDIRFGGIIEMAVQNMKGMGMLPRGPNG